MHSFLLAQKVSGRPHSISAQYDCSSVTSPKGPGMECESFGPKLPTQWTILPKEMVGGLTAPEVEVLMCFAMGTGYMTEIEKREREGAMIGSTGAVNNAAMGGPA